VTILTNALITQSLLTATKNANEDKFIQTRLPGRLTEYDLTCYRTGCFNRKAQ